MSWVLFLFSCCFRSHIASVSVLFQFAYFFVFFRSRVVSILLLFPFYAISVLCCFRFCIDIAHHALFSCCFRFLLFSFCVLLFLFSCFSILWLFPFSVVCILVLFPFSCFFPDHVLFPSNNFVFALFHRDIFVLVLFPFPRCFRFRFVCVLVLFSFFPVILLFLFSITGEIVSG